MSVAPSAVSSIAFGYLVGYSGSYSVPFVPMVVTLAIGAWVWLTVDPTDEIFEEETPLSPVVAVAATAS